MLPDGPIKIFKMEDFRKHSGFLTGYDYLPDRDGVIDVVLNNYHDRDELFSLGVAYASAFFGLCYGLYENGRLTPDAAVNLFKTLTRLKLYWSRIDRLQDRSLTHPAELDTILALRLALFAEFLYQDINKQFFERWVPGEYVQFV